MPHYKDGTEARKGDIVKGRGYNIPYEVTGMVLQVTQEEACNIIIATVGPDVTLQYDGFLTKKPQLPESAQNHNPFGISYLPNVIAQKEYGACKDFELLHRP